MPRYSGKAVLRFVHLIMCLNFFFILEIKQGEVEVRNPLLQVDRHGRLREGELTQRGGRRQWQQRQWGAQRGWRE